MSAPRLRVYRVVWLDFHADPSVAPALPVGAPHAGLVVKFLDWQRETMTFPARECGGTTGPGIYRAAFHEADAERVLAWWAEHGVKAQKGRRR